MSKTLTEQWREGTLPLNHYYVKTKSGRYGINHTVLSFDGDKPRTRLEYSDRTEEVLAPVPSYDEHKRLVSNSDESAQKIHILNEQNTKQYNELCEEIKKNNILEKKLKIATKALDHCQGFDFVQYALKEMEGVK